MKAAGGVSLDTGVHLFHRIRTLCGGVEEVSAATPAIESQRMLRDDSGQTIETVDCEIDDSFFACFRFENGAWGSIAHSRAGHGEITRSPEVVYGEKGCLKGRDLILDASKTTLSEVYEDSVSEEQKGIWFPKGITNPFALKDLDFFRSIETGEPMETNALEGLQDLACCFSLLESAEARRAVLVQDVYEGKIEAYQNPVNRQYGL